MSRPLVLGCEYDLLEIDNNTDGVELFNIPQSHYDSDLHTTQKHTKN